MHMHLLLLHNQKCLFITISHYMHLIEFPKALSVHSGQTELCEIVPLNIKMSLNRRCILKF